MGCTLKLLLAWYQHAMGMACASLQMHAVVSHGVDKLHATLNDAENDEPSIAINVTLALSPFSQSVRVGGTANTYALENLCSFFMVMWT